MYNFLCKDKIKCPIILFFSNKIYNDSQKSVFLHKKQNITNASIDQIVATVPNAKSFNAFKNIWVVKACHDGDIETDIAPIFSIFPQTLLDSTTDPTTELKAMDHYAEAQRFFEARAQVSLRGHVD